MRPSALKPRWAASPLAQRQARGENVLAEKTEAEETKVAAEELFEDGAAPKVEAEEGVESE